MTTTQEIEKQAPTQRALTGIVARVAAQYDMEEGDFARVLIATIFPKGPKAPPATRAHVAALCIVADQYGLNPLLKQVYAFPDKSGGIVPIVSVDGWYYLANKHPQFDGITFEEHEDEKGNIVACTATVYRKDRSHPTRVTEHVRECRRDTDPWRNQPRRMIRHRAAIQAIRVAFNIAALDPEDSERIPEFEVYPAGDAVSKINDEILQEAEAEKKPAPEKEDGIPAEPPKEPRRRARTPKGFATKAQRQEFEKMIDDGTVDNGFVSPHLPEEPELLEDAFAAMSKDDAEALLVRCRSGEFAPPTAETAPAGSPPEAKSEPPQSARGDEGRHPEAGEQRLAFEL